MEADVAHPEAQGETGKHHLVIGGIATIATSRKQGRFIKSQHILEKGAGAFKFVETAEPCIDVNGTHCSPCSHGFAQIHYLFYPPLVQVGRFTAMVEGYIVDAGKLIAGKL